MKGLVILSKVQNLVGFNPGADMRPEFGQV